MVKSSQRKFRVSHSDHWLEKLASENEGTSVDGGRPEKRRRMRAPAENVSGNHTKPLPGGDLMVNGRVKIQVVQGDITEERSDCIVNSTDDFLGLSKRQKRPTEKCVFLHLSFISFDVFRLTGFTGNHQKRWKIDRKRMQKNRTCG